MKYSKYQNIKWSFQKWKDINKCSEITFMEVVFSNYEIVELSSFLDLPATCIFVSQIQMVIIGLSR